MKKLSAFMLVGLLSGGIASAQNNVGINTATPSASAALAIDTAATGPQGLLIPRMTQARRDAISSPALGLMVYQTNNTPGFYYHNGTTWVPFVSSSTGGGAIIPFSSGTTPIIVTTILGGLVGTVSTTAFGSAATGISLVGGALDLSPILADNQAFSAPRTGTITSISADLKTTIALNLVGSTVTVTAQLYSAAAGTNSFTAVAGALVNMPITGLVAIGNSFSGSTTGLSIPVTVGTKYIMVYSASATGLSLLNTYTGAASAGVSIQ